MLAIPSINAEMVQLYGKHFYALIHKGRGTYISMCKDDGVDPGEFVDKPLDPNHENVVEISSDEDYGDYYDDEAEEEEEEQVLPSSQSSMGERSGYFKPPPDALVAKFNAQSKSSA